MPNRSKPSAPRHTLPASRRGRSSLMSHALSALPVLRHLRPSARSRRRALLGALIVALLGATPTVHGASASSTVNTGAAPQLGGFSARALDENGQVTPQTFFELKLKPGEVFNGQILVSNASEDFVRLKVDSVDGLTGQTSGTVYANRTDPRAETSRWIRPKKRALRLDGGGSRTLRFRLRVPDDARPGDHVGAVAFQRILNPKKEGNFSVRQVLRVAVAIQIRVEGPAEPRLEIGKLSLKALGGTQIPSLGIELKNTGQLLCRPALTVDLVQGDTALGQVSKQLDTILAGDTIDFPLPWPRPLEAGTYRATVATTGCGAPARTTAEVELADTLRGTTGAPGPDVSMLDDDDDGLPVWALVLGILAALGLGFFLARRTGRREEPVAAAPAPGAAAVAAASVADAPAGSAGAQAVEPEPDPAPDSAGQDRRDGDASTRGPER